MRQRSGWKRGMSVTEVVIASAVLLLLLSGLVTVMISAAHEWSFGSSKMMADNDASLALQRIAREVRDGNRATVNAAGTELTVIFPYVNPNTGDYDRFTDGDTILYYMSNGVLYRKKGTATPTRLGKNLTAVEFSVSGSEVEISLTSYQKQGVRDGETTITTRVKLRNDPPV